MKVYTVSQINEIIKNHIESASVFREICIEGIASNVTYQLKHLYLSIKENEKIRIKCAAFNYRYKDIDVNIKDLDKIRVYGNVNVYKDEAVLQIVASKIEKYTEKSDLYKKLEELKKYFNEKGYFDQSIKKSLPYNARKIGVVTSDTGDAIRDIIKNTHLLDSSVDIYLYPAKVQGIDSAKTIVEGIEFFNKYTEIDVDCIIIGRGGGSIEDLWSFNEEIVVESIYKSKIPIISAVGHEADVLLSDFVADFRASTPTQAPHSIIKNRKIVEKEIKDMYDKLNNILSNKIDRSIKELKYIKNSYVIKNFKDNLLNEKYMNLQFLSQKLEKNINKLFSTKEKRMQLENLKKSLDNILKIKIEEKKKEIIKLNENKLIINSIKKELNYLLSSNIEIKKQKLKHSKAKIEKHNIDELLDRGFTLTYVDNSLIKDAKINKDSLIKTVYKGRKEIISEVK